MAAPKLLLHVCCAPCATHCVNVLSRQFDVTAYFYNPNIYPPEEYELRFREVVRYAGQINLKLFTGGYDSRQWAEAVKGYENEREGGQRCSLCYKIRLAGAAQFARAQNIEYVATTLTVSPHKRADVINPIGEGVAEKYGLRFYGSDFKKNDGFKLSCQMSRELGLYRQNYCGCVFSYRGSVHKTRAQERVF